MLHGGGNTSLKTEMEDLLGETHEVLCVKGSGWDMGAIDPSGFAAVKLAPLRKLRSLDDLSDEDMVRVQRAYLLDPLAPDPSVEFLLHAFMPHKYVDHTHANAILALIDQPNGAELAREVYGGRLGLVPYDRPGFGLARKAADVLDAKPEVEGLILDKHGIFTFGSSAARGLRAHDRDGDAGRGAPETRAQGGVQGGGAAEGDRAAGRGGADPARRLQLAGRQGSRARGGGW